ncbi:MAG: winged helix-turn-helix domain-containing protein, partial [Polyangiaceae bacterium]|nr:winged helix-turn-helix domain-containing protein [Polyangiaceae bacterium]
MTFTEAALQVLRLVGKPLHYKEITEAAIEKSLLSHVGKSPEVTMGSRLSAQVKKAMKENPLQRVKPGVFALTDWDEKAIQAGLADKKPAVEILRALDAAEAEKATELASEEESAAQGESKPADVAEGASDGAASAEESSSEESSTEEAVVVESAAQPLASHQELDQGATPPDEEEIHRAELTAAANDLFEAEEDDDQPILGAEPEKPRRSRRGRQREERGARGRGREDRESDDSDESEDSRSTEAQDDVEDERADGRRRRRRRRGRKGRDEADTNGDRLDDDLPGYTVSDAAPEENQYDLDEDGLEEREEEALSLPVLIVGALRGRDRGRSLVAAQSLADSLRRRKKVENSTNGAALLAAAIAENHRAESRTGLPVFRISGQKIGLWS